MIDYKDFVMSKLVSTKPCGIAKDQQSAINSGGIKELKDWQIDVVSWSLERGRAAIFADCGLGKTAMQLEWANNVSKYTESPVLILAPLAVADQTKQESIDFGIDCKVEIVRDESQIDGPGIYIANYEMLDHFDDAYFGGIVLDESSILKSYDGRTKKKIISRFSNADFRLACTATPAPNDHVELTNHAEFLGIKSSSETLATWFINDTFKTGDWRLKRHAVDDFWRWVGTWAVCFAKPSDIGEYSDEGYILPSLNIHTHVVDVDISKVDIGESQLSIVNNSPNLSATNMHNVMRVSAPYRADKASEIVDDDDYYIVWCNTNYEADELIDRIPDAVEVRGSEKPKDKTEKLNKYTRGEVRAIITKPSIAGYGLNWQHCNNVIFVGLSYSFEDLYQALRRSYRFGQKEEVNAHIIMGSGETSIMERIEKKIERHDEMRDRMVRSINKNGSFSKREITMNHDIDCERNDEWTLYNGDCVEVAKTIDDNQIDFSVYSPPFSDVFVYSDSIYDMGNSKNDNEFMAQYSFIVKEIYRLTKNGRLTAVHCKDLLSLKGRDGFIGVKDFSGDIVKIHQDAGWIYHSRITIWKNPVTEMQRTKSIGLLHKQLCKDSTMSRQGLPDYLLIFRKDDESAEKDGVKGIDDKHRFDYYVGEDSPDHNGDDREYSINVWQRYASPVWFDIDQTNVLNYKDARCEQDEKHMCPLQLDVIERAIHLWSNHGDVVFSPFAGIGSEGYGALLQSRKFIGAELKKEYFEKAKSNLDLAIEMRESSKKQLSII
jgi:DNA modification methylase